MKSIKKMLTAFLLLCIMAFSVTGCFNKQVIVATINGESISEQLYRIYLWSSQRGLETAQENYWSFENIQGKSPEEFLKAKALESTALGVIVEQKAKELDIHLTKVEKKTIKEAAEKAMEDNKDFAKQYNIKQKDYERYYTFAIQYEKVIQLLANSYVPNEAEVAAESEELIKNGETTDSATIAHVLISTRNELGEEIPADKKQEAYEKAKSILNKALAGEDMKTLAKTYSDDELTSYTFTRGEDGLSKQIEQVVFEEAEVGTVYPEIIETEYGYEIIKVTDVKSNVRQDAIQLIKVDYAMSELEEMTIFAEIETNENYDAIVVGPSVSMQGEETQEAAS